MLSNTILNVDDNPVSRYARSQVLRQAGYLVLEAGTGEEAFAVVNEAHPALVLLDVNLPDISGFDVCRRIKAHPQAAGIPVLHISATAVEEHDLITGLQAADAYVVEPVQPEMLLAFVGALLRGSELLRQWVAVFDALADGVALLTDEGTIMRCNSAFCRLVGKRIGDILGHSITQVVGAAQGSSTELAFTRSLHTRQSETTELPFGDKIYRLTSHLALIRGSVAGAIYMISDVTTERRAGREKEEALALLRALADSSPVGFAFFDREMCYRLVNKELARIDGATIEAHIGHTPEEIVPGMAPAIRLALGEVIETGQPVLDRELSGAGVNSGDQSRSWSVSWYPVKAADGRMIGVGATVVETTEQKRAEKSRQDLEKRMLDAQRLESIGLLAGGIAHDFNNLLTGILGNASLAREMVPPGTALAHFLEGIVNASERAAHLTKQMLAYSGKGQLFVESVDLSQEIQEVLRLVQPSISRKISVVLDLPNDLPKVQADKGQLQQVLMNLVVNAAEAIGEQPGVLSVKTSRRTLSEAGIRDLPAAAGMEAGNYVCVEVRDTGCGMDEETKTRIFDPFFTTKFTGRGLGLAAVSGIMRGHKGGINVTTAPGEGSTFAAYFPATNEKEHPAPEATPPQAVSKNLPCGTVLVVDDEPVVLRVARNALEHSGCTVLTAESGPAAIELFRRYCKDISLIVLDLSMPGMSGLETLPELRRIRPDVLVVISSGYSESETLRLFSGHRISGFLQKPYSSQRLLELVNAAADEPQPDPVLRTMPKSAQ